MKKIVHKPAAPLYAAAAVWVLYALLFPLYRVGHFVIVLAASAAVYGIARLFCKDVVEEVPEEPKTTGNPELDKMVSEGQGALEEMRRLNDSIRRSHVHGRAVFGHVDEVVLRVDAPFDDQRPDAALQLG